MKRSHAKHSVYDECASLTDSSVDDQRKAVGAKQKKEIRAACRLDRLQCLVMSLGMLKLFPSLHKGC